MKSRAIVSERIRPRAISAGPFICPGDGKQTKPDTEKRESINCLPSPVFPADCRRVARRRLLSGNLPSFRHPASVLNARISPPPPGLPRTGRKEHNGDATHGDVEVHVAQLWTSLLTYCTSVPHASPAEIVFDNRNRYRLKINLSRGATLRNHTCNTKG